jgi:hypothetical protein
MSQLALQLVFIAFIGLVGFFLLTVKAVVANSQKAHGVVADALESRTDSIRSAPLIKLTDRFDGRTGQHKCQHALWSGVSRALTRAYAMLLSSLPRLWAGLTAMHDEVVITNSTAQFLSISVGFHSNFDAIRVAIEPGRSVTVRG